MVRGKGEYPFITVCMAVLNEEQDINRTLGDLLNQNYPGDRFEVIIADGGSNDETMAILEHYAELSKIFIIKHNRQRVAAAGRNIGLQTGQGDVFVFLDGHCHIPSRNWLQNMVSILHKERADCLARPQPQTFPENSRFQDAVAFCRQSQAGHASNSLIYSSHEGFVSPISHGAIYTRKVIEKLGGLNEGFDACEDVEFNFRVEKAGFKTYMSERLTVCYRPRRSIKTLFRQVFRYGRGRAKLIVEHPEAFNSDLALAPLPAIAVTAAFGTVLAVPATLPMIAGLAGMYALLATGCGLLSKPKAPNGALIFLPAVFFTIHIGFSVGFLIGLFAERQSLRHYFSGLSRVREYERLPEGGLN